MLGRNRSSHGLERVATHLPKIAAIPGAMAFTTPDGHRQRGPLTQGWALWPQRGRRSGPGPAPMARLLEYNHRARLGVTRCLPGRQRGRPDRYRSGMAFPYGAPCRLGCSGAEAAIEAGALPGASQLGRVVVHLAECGTTARDVPRCRARVLAHGFGQPRESAGAAPVPPEGCGAGGGRRGGRARGRDCQPSTPRCGADQDRTRRAGRRRAVAVRGAGLVHRRGPGADPGSARCWPVHPHRIRVPGLRAGVGSLAFTRHPLRGPNRPARCYSPTLAPVPCRIGLDSHPAGVLPAGLKRTSSHFPAPLIVA